MKHHVSFAVGVLLVCSGCGLRAQEEWPARQNKAPEEILRNVVVWQQRLEVRPSYGELAGQCFTRDDYESFVAEDRPARLVARLRAAKDFAVVTAALRTLPPEKLVKEMRAARQLARPTWAELGHIDPDGRGQTEAGHAAELLIAEAIVDAFAAQLGVDASLMVR